MKKIILIKLGGSLITHKNKAFSIRNVELRKITKEIKEILNIRSRYQIILANGAGSFGHFLAKKYKTTKGIIDDGYGFCIEQDGDKKLNQIIIEYLLKEKIKCASFHPSSLMISSGGKLKEIFLDSLVASLNLDIMPVLYGAVIYDLNKGCHIFSTEDLFDILVNELSKKRFKVDKVIHLTTVNGVLDRDNKIIPKVTRTNYSKIKKNLFATYGHDVTGGMKHKIERSLELAKKNIKTYIVNGRSQENILLKIIENKKFDGTLVE